MRTIESRHVVPDIVEEHFEELSCLLVVRRSLLVSPDAVLVQYEDLLKRLEAHRDGLRVAEAVGLETVRKNLESGHPFDVAAALGMWIQLGHPDPAEILAWLEEAPEEMLPAWCEAFRLLPAEVAREALPSDAPADGKPAVQAALLDARAWHGLSGAGSLRGPSSHSDPIVRAAAARAHGFLGAPPPRELLTDVEPEVRQRGLWSTFLGSPGRALEECRRVAQGPEPDLFALRLLGLAGEQRDMMALRRAVRGEETADAALLAMGDLGRVEAVPLLLGALADGNEMAAEALTRIVGELPEGPDGDDEALPDAAVLREWWSDRSSEFADDARFVRGVPFPYAGEPGRETMESCWLAAVLSIEGPIWHKKEAPDGFFTGLPSLEAETGV